MTALAAEPNEDVPEPVRACGTPRARTLDVRGILKKGGDPFHLIVDTVRKLAPDEALHLVVGFDPKPLYLVMRTFGRASHTERRGGAVHVWFYRKDAGQAPTQKRDPAADVRAPLQPPVPLDVRGLEPPQPMITILEKLGELGPGGQLLVKHHREPVLLYEKLALRGYAARATEGDDGVWTIHIAPEWAFEEAKR